MRFDFCKMVLVALLAAPLVLCAQPIEKPVPAQPAAQTNSSTNRQPPRSVLRTIVHDLNPVVWFNYLSHREPCDYAYVQAYGTCGPKSPLH
jgi:hypothetical protein